MTESSGTWDDDIEPMDHSTTIDAGSVLRAPMPISKVLRMEVKTNSRDGAYFVELMRKRLRAIYWLQEKWISRVCNQKHAKHVDAQIKLRDFMGTVCAAFDEQFGSDSQMAAIAQVRQRSKNVSKQNNTDGRRGYQSGSFAS
jgi:hypothetical protein